MGDGQRQDASVLIFIRTQCSDDRARTVFLTFIAPLQ
jgi:hypothetical protein